MNVFIDKVIFRKTVKEKEERMKIFDNTIMELKVKTKEI